MKDIDKNFKMQLAIDGRHIPLKPFLANFVKQIILAMVLNLKGIEKPKRIELILRKVPRRHT